jgi:hypothetical protein
MLDPLAPLVRACTDGSAGRPGRRPEPGPVRQRVPPHEPGSAVCVQRAQRRRRHRPGLGVPGLGRRHIVAGDLPVRRRQTAPCWVEITQHGRFLFTVNTGSGTISRCVIAPGGALTLLGSTPVGATGGRVSAGPDLPAVRRPDPSHPGRRRHRVYHGGRNTSSTFRTWRQPAGLVVRLVASFRTGRITRGSEPKRPRQSCPASAPHVRPGRDGPLNTRGAVPGTPPPDRQGD